MQELKKFVDETSGATAIEYALIAGGISLAIAAIVFTLGGQLSAAFSAMAGLIAALV
ncbi:MAG: Flp family type IVb pilin [Alphaproteobacteria bacterium]|jgi:pilus assembly protein Flp/PilA